MYHTIEFRVPGRARVERQGTAVPVQVSIRQGARFKARIQPYVLESSLGPVEVADLFLEDGTAARAVRFASFHFVDE